MKALLYFLLNFLMINAFNPSTIDYCKLTCDRMGNKFVSSACKCTKKGARREISDDLVGYRKQILNAHNDFRNAFAGGSQEANKYPKAANMHVFNYDMELEHVARCYAINSFQNTHDKCRQVSYCTNGSPGQNLCFSSGLNNNDWKGFINGCFNSWVDELKAVPENEREQLINQYQGGSVVAGHFTQAIWATATRVGCVRMHNPKGEQMFKYVYMCNYAGPDNSCSCNVLTQKVYITGNPCSQCGDEKCNKDTSGGKYDNLCGELKPVPTDTVTPTSKVSDGSPVSVWTVLLSVNVLLFNLQ